MEKNVKNLLVGVGALSLLSAVLGLWFGQSGLPSMMTTLMPGLVTWVGELSAAAGVGAVARAISFVTLSLAAFMGWTMYFLPSLIAQQSRHPRRFAVLWINLLLGWTLLGWFAAFFWILRDSAPTDTDESEKP